MRKTVTIAAIATAALAVTVGAASAAPAHPAEQRSAWPGTVAFEVDNGTTWTLADRTSHEGRLSSSGPEQGYADAGVVVDLGPAADFTGITITGSQNLAENIWITDGSQATVPGTHPLSSPANFDYGLGVTGGWYMTGKPDAWNAKTLTAAQIRSDFAGYQVWAWVGIDDSGTTDYGYVTSVNGHRASAILGLEEAAGSVTAYVLRFSPWSGG
jgi:Ca2+-binding RTX toxin-like protein